MGVHRCMPLDEIEALDEVNCLDAHIVEKRDRFVVVDVKRAVMVQQTLAQILTTHSILVIFPRPLMVVLRALCWVSTKSSSRSILASFSASRCALTFAMSFWPTKLRIVTKLVSNFNNSREARWMLVVINKVAKFFEMKFIDLWVVKGLRRSARSVGTWLKHVVGILTA